ncbi:unnamed protein product [Linum trigynum]|uniref:Uncharacterized protein n=1 Tax=Linum trigynum TaxID=586398 RepID=A0AAV2GKA8_9ROSI
MDRPSDKENHRRHQDQPKQSMPPLSSFSLWVVSSIGAIDLSIPSARSMLPSSSNHVFVPPPTSSPPVPRCCFLIPVSLVAVNSTAFSILVCRTTNLSRRRWIHRPLTKTNR